jgi:multicomponent Na+:H+ antiporter subunit G
VNIAGGALLIGGLFFMAVAALGLLRLPDFFSRAHAVSKAETLGIVLALLGLAIYDRGSLVSLKLGLALIFVFLANPVAAHLLTRAAIRSGMMPWTRREGPSSRPPDSQ